MVHYKDLKPGETLVNIKIENMSGSCSLTAHAGAILLFYFEYRDWENKWYFWPNTDFNPTVFDKPEFPMEYFENLCKAKYFCLTGTDDWPTYINIVAGKKFLKVAPSVK